MRILLQRCTLRTRERNITERGVDPWQNPNMPFHAPMQKRGAIRRAECVSHRTE